MNESDLTDDTLDGLLRASAPEPLLSEPGQLLQYLLDRMLAGHEQDDDVTVLVMHVPGGSPGEAGNTGGAGYRQAREQWAPR